ncbi:divergent PAP2 family protein [Petrocella sp. FN5]|uniref:divergent PAP2 family protein n=1 Tax=Petrocella sp. FN5 TaxID=3032002 RepID=UPI0023DCD509|nr:divergent PAP2 family protein [Petrocella sp. FN5]MDF1617012.1 divergent PAP2 family protein [Petrocella sp. FN5]
MNEISDLLTNRVFLSAMLAWFIAQSIKITWILIKEKRFDVGRLMGSGGMPSAHSASVVATTFSIGRIMGFNSPVFGFAGMMSFIVMYDAANVRMAAGKQAKLINRIIKELGEHKFSMYKELKELLGHTYLEVFVGALLGMIIGLNMA